MSATDTDIGAQARTLAQLIGLLDAEGGLVSSWFDDPMSAIADVLSNSTQRDAAVELLDLLLPETPGAPAGWRRIVEDGGFSVFLTTDTSGSALTLGVAGTVEADNGVRIELTVPLLDAPGGGVDPTPIVGSTDGRIHLDLHVPVGLDTAELRLAALQGAVELQFEPSVDVVPSVELLGLALGSATPSDFRFDSRDPGGDVVDLVLGLLHDALAQPGVPGEIADHLLPLLGLGAGTSSIPRLPILDLAEDPAAARGWIRDLVEGTGMSDWLGHLAGLLGASGAVAGSGSESDPWRVALFTESHLSLDLVVSASDGRLWPGLEIRAGEDQDSDPTGLHLLARSVVMGFPYVGLDDPEVAPDVRVLVRSPSPLIAPGGPFSCGRLQAGITWNGTGLDPLLELFDVVIDGSTHARVDLTQAEDIGGLVGSAIEAALDPIVGPGRGRHLLALAGVVPPSAAAPGWPHALDVTQFVVDPLGAIAAYHRAVLQDATHTWAALHAEVAGLVGLGGVTGAGTESDPWGFDLASAGAVSVRMEAWRVSDGGGESLRLGLGVDAASAPFALGAFAELAAFSMPSSGAPSLDVGARLAGRLVIDPLPEPPDMGDFSIRADSVSAFVDWRPGRDVGWDVRVPGVEVALGSGSVPSFDLRFPTAALDFSDPAATAAGLGISTAQLDATVRGLVWRAARSWGGRDGQLLATLAGFGTGTWGLPADLPLLGGNGGALLDDPLGAFRPWVAQLVGAPGADGLPPVTHLVRLAQAWTDGIMPTRFGPFLDDRGEVAGRGTPDDPWLLSLGGAGEFSASLWVGPAGPALPALPGVSGGDTDVVAGLAQRIRDDVEGLRATLESTDGARLSAGIEALDTFLRSSDGHVPIVSQQPEGWTAPAPVEATHAQLPAHADVLAAIRQHVVDRAGSPVTLLVSAPFADRATWAPLLSSAGLPGTVDAAAHFDLRVPDLEPSGVDLGVVTAVADWYTADLGDAGNTDSEEAQIERILDRLATLAAGRKVVLVAHSTSGRAARRVAAAHADRVAGIVTVGTPHLGAAPPWATEEAAGLALHVARVVLPSLPAGALRTALEHAGAVLDGETGAPWTPSFLDSPDVDVGVGAVPALALAGRVGAGLGAALETALRDRDPGARPTADHLGVCLRGALGMPVRDVDLGIRTELELELGRIGLDGGTADVSDPRLTVRVNLDGAGGWLLGGPGLRPDGRPWAARCRSATLEASLHDGEVDFSVRLDGASRGAPAVLDLDHPRSAEVLDGIFARLSSHALAEPLLDDLRRVGLAVEAPGGGWRLSTDAVTAFRGTGLAWLRPRLSAAFDAGLTAVSGAAPTPIGVELPLQLEVLRDPWRLKVSTVGDGLSLGDDGKLDLTLEVSLPDGATHCSAEASLGAFGIRFEDGAISVRAGTWMEPLTLLPADPAAFSARLEELLPRLVFSSATSALVESTLPSGMRLGPLDRLFAGPADDSGTGGGGGTPTPPPPASAIQPLLEVLNRALGNPLDPALHLPGDFVVEVADVSGATRMLLRTTAPLGGVVDVELGVDVAAGLAVTPAAGVTVAIPDGGGGTLVEVELSAGAGGTGLEIRPAGASTITILPSFSGFGGILSGGVALLPRVLDALDDEVPAGPVKTAVLDVATAMDVYDAGGGFAAHTARFQELLDGSWNRSGPQQAALVGASRALVGLIPSLPGTVGGTGTQLTWTLAVSGGATGSISVGIDWADDVPVITAGVSGLQAAGVPAALDLSVSVTPMAPDPFLVEVGAGVVEPLDLPIRPSAALSATSSGVTLALHPLATSGGDGPLALTLLPTPDLVAAPDLAERVVGDVLFPLLLGLIDRVAGTGPLWAGGPTLRAVLQASGLLDPGGSVSVPPPPVLDVVAGAATALSAEVALGDLTLVLGNVGAGLGVGVRGHLDIPIDDVALVLHFESPDGWVMSPPTAPVRLVLMQNAGGWTFSPRLDAAGLGIGLAGNDGDLVRSDLLRLKGVDAYVFFGLGFHPWSAQFDGAGVALDGVGLPLNQLSGGGGNGVVAGLLNSGDAASGEPGGAQPALDIAAWYLDHTFHVRFDGDPGPYWLTVQTAFGPLYIEQVGVGLMQQDGATVGVDLLVDGGVSFAGLSVMVDDLTLGVPFRSLGSPGDWSIDLAGLAVAYDGSGVKIAGGLVKSGTGANVEYIGMLMVEVQSFGLVAIGAWGSLSDEEGEYTSLFVFAALFLTISFPPYLEIRGIGLGFGYNRRLVVPEDITAIPGFPLVSALDDGGDFLENPMAALMAMKQNVPARRGSYWFAVGFHGSTFVVVQITAVLYVALDSGVEVGVVGVASMMLPTKDTALVSIELALKARFSSSEGLLSIQGQLTDNSWLLSRDCQLTGGFAFFMWFERGQFLITIGGYHPSFQREPEYPEVPRLGIRWDLGPIHIKGESYFALTNSAVMAGVRVEASYTLGDWLKVWFKAWADFLLQWDPFYYDVSIGVDLGARVSFTINLLFGKVHITLSISIGAELRVFGPPIRGVVKAHLGPFEVTVAFGSSNQDKDYLLWPAFRDKYVLGEDPSAPATALAPGQGLIRPEEKGADPPTGAGGDPWKMNSEFGLRTETRMPGSTYRGPSASASTRPDGLNDLDAAPMNVEDLTSDHIVTVERHEGGSWKDIRDWNGAGLDWNPGPQIEITVRTDRFPEAVWRLGEVAAASRNITAIGGLNLSFKAVTDGDATLPIPVATLVDPLPFAPNPFTQRSTRFAPLRDAAIRVKDLLAEAGTVGRIQAARTFLERGGRFDEQREALGAKARGMDAVALGELSRRRTPPRVLPLATGLTMEPIPFSAPPAVREVVPVLPVALERPRLRARSELPASAPRPQAVSLRTTVGDAYANVRRVLAPRLDVGEGMETLGARLVRVSTPGGVPGTRTARTTRTTMGDFTGAPVAPARLKAMEALTEAVVARGVALPPGEVQHWEIPGGAGRRVTFHGDGAVRLLCLGRGSRVLLDEERAVAGEADVVLPERTAQVVVTSLGKVAKEVQPGSGAVSAAFSPGGVAAVGWQAHSTLFAATPALLQARGSRIRLSAPTDKPTGAPLVASSALSGVRALETWLPARAGTLVLVLERGGAGALEQPEVGIVGAELGTPLREQAGRRHVWLYPVMPGSGSEMGVTVSVGEAWKVSGVVLVSGRPAEVGARIEGSVVPQFVSDGPISPSGTLRMSLSPEAGEPR